LEKDPETPPPGLSGGAPSGTGGAGGREGAVRDGGGAGEGGVPGRGPSAGKGRIPGDWLYLGFTHAPLAALGPGLRVGVWTRGCGLGCPGCVAPELRTARPEDAVAATELAAWAAGTARERGLRGLTVSGGEPFHRPEALKAFLELCRAGGLDDVLVYSGRRASELVVSFPWVPDLVTALVDGPFELGRPSSRPWKGSEGQTLTVFGKGELARLYAAWEASDERPLQMVAFPDGAVRILGIPKIGAYDSIFGARDGPVPGGG
jgi:anaerobic ribonucleoside-triphosphate reductase activating protein